MSKEGEVACEICGRANCSWSFHRPSEQSQAESEKQVRIKYQDLTYAAMILVDYILDEPMCTETFGNDLVRAKSAVHALRAKLSEVEAQEQATDALLLEAKAKKADLEWVVADKDAAIGRLQGELTNTLAEVSVLRSMVRAADARRDEALAELSRLRAYVAGRPCENPVERWPALLLGVHYKEQPKPYYEDCGKCDPCVARAAKDAQ